jgi:hypothetical protein
MAFTEYGGCVIVQLQVKDFNAGEQRTKTAFTAPASAGSPTVGNFTNVFTTDLYTTGRINSMALGTGSAAEDTTHTGLQAELTTDGLARRIDTDINTYLTDAVGAENAWKMNWQTTWTATGNVPNLRELLLGSNPAASATANTGIGVIRQVLAEDLAVVIGDLVNVKLTTKLTGTLSTSGSPPATQAVVPAEALREFLRNFTDPNTNRRGEDAGAGDWQTDYTIGGVAARVERQFDQVAIGDGGSRSFSINDTALGDEHGSGHIPATADLARRKDGDVDGDVRGSLMQAHLGGTTIPWNGFDDSGDTSPGNQGDAFGADAFTVFAGDTVQLAARFNFTGTRHINEQSFQNGDDPSGAGPPPDDPGVMGVEFSDALDIAGDEDFFFIPILRLQCQVV